MTEELDKSYIKSVIQLILNKVHVEPQKRNIKEFSDRFNFACPICGDSHKNINAKRGNMYFNTMHYVCFNEKCGRSFIKLLKTFEVDIDLQKKMDIYNYIDNNVHWNKKEDNYVLQRLDKLIDIDFLIETLNNNPSSQFSKFGPIKTNSAAYQYLKFERLIDNFENIYEAEYTVTPKWKEKVIVILNKSGNKVLGLQIRNLKSGDKRWFKIFNFEKLHNMVHPEDPLDELEALSYNKISNFYNILNVDWDKPVTIFEAYLDSTFFPNAIGAIGLNSINDMGFLLSDDLDTRFFFDQDEVGIKNSIVMLDKGYKVFLWQKLNVDFLKNKVDKYQAEKILLKIKDLNKLVQDMKNTDPYNKLKLDKYFSNDTFDKIYLDFTKYPKNSKSKN
jgi:hypothetical protein